MDFPDSIFALSSGKLPSGVAVVRMSGRHVDEALCRLTGRIPEPRKAKLAVVRDAEGDVIDRALILYFPSPASFTGESVAELHLHGGRAVAAAVLAQLALIEGMRFAEAGEFTRRAFLNGKLDLSAAEAMSDLIAAETEAQRRLAVLGAQGRHREHYTNWRRQILALRAEIEAHLDFSDQEDVPAALPMGRLADLDMLADEIEAHASRYRRSEMIRDGFRVVIVGAPNAGKSSLLNALAQRDVAIVTDEPGTTRDVLEVALDLGGDKVVLVDTAGLREAASKVEAIGIERAQAAAQGADLVIELVDLSAPVELETPASREVVRVGSKSDLLESGTPTSVELAVSARTGEGLNKLLDHLAERVQVAVGVEAELLPLRERHVALLQGAARHLRAARREEALELCAENLRLASAELGSIVGIVHSEELLGEIFGRFCIGK